MFFIDVSFLEFLYNCTFFDFLISNILLFLSSLQPHFPIFRSRNCNISLSIPFFSTKTMQIYCIFLKKAVSLPKIYRI